MKIVVEKWEVKQLKINGRIVKPSELLSYKEQGYWDKYHDIQTCCFQKK